MPDEGRRVKSIWNDFIAGILCLAFIYILVFAFVDDILGKGQILFSLTVNILATVWNYMIDFLKEIWNNADKIGALATAIAAFIAARTLQQGYREYRRAEESEKKQMTYAFINKYYDPTFLTFTESARERMRLGPPLTLENVKTEYVMVSKIISFFNYFEDASRMYNDNALDRDAFKILMKTSIILTYKRAFDVIMLLKEAGYSSPSEGYIQWYLCAKDLAPDDENIKSPIKKDPNVS